MATASDPIWRIDPAEQRRRDQLALGLKESELASDPTNADLQRDVGFTRAALAGVRAPASSPAPSGPGFVRPAFQTSTPEIDSAVEQRTQNWQDLEQRTGPLRQQVDTAQRGVEEFAGSPRTTRPPLGGLPTYQPKPYSQEDALGFGAIATAFAALVGMRTRTPLTLALSAAGNAMQGFTKGRMDQVNQELKVFKEQFDSALATNKQHMDEYNAIMNDRKSTLAEKESLLKVLSARYHDEVGLAMLRDERISQYIDLQWKRKEAADRTSEKAAEFEQNVRDKALDRANRLEVAGIRGNNALTTPAELTPEAIDNAASFFILNGRMPIGLARLGPQALGLIQNRAAQMTQEAGLTPQEFAAAGPITRQKLGALMQLEKNRNAIQAYEQMLDLNIGILKDLSKNVSRSDSPYANRPLLWLKQNAAGDPQVAEYLFQVTTVATEIARVLNNPNLTGQLTDTARQELETVVSGTLNPQQLDAVLTRAQRDARNRSQSFDRQVQKVISEIRDPLHKSGGPVSATPEEIDAELRRRGVIQ